MAIPAAAAAAYRAAAQITTPAASAGAAPAGGSFADFLSGAVKDSISTIKQGETMATKQAAGQANIVDVVN